MSTTAPISFSLSCGCAFTVDGQRIWCPTCNDERQMPEHILAAAKQLAEAAEALVDTIGYEETGHDELQSLIAALAAWKEAQNG